MDKLILAPSAGRLGIEQFGDPSLTHFATELSSDKAALRQNLDSLDGAARVPGSRYLEQAILGIRGAFQAFGRPDAQKVMVLLAGGPPEDAPFEKAWVLKEQLNCTVLVVIPQPESSPPQGVLKTEHDETKCLDYNFNNGNVYMHDCHTDDNQLWYFSTAGELKTLHDGKCLDYNYRSGNVYMHDCHGGANQKWHINPDGMMGTSYDSKCLDFNYRTMNVYMHDCHGESNQLWVHPQRTAHESFASDASYDNVASSPAWQIYQIRAELRRCRR
jgi:hypothetical protein